MKHFKQFFVFALLALFSVGAWGATASLTSVSTKEVVETKGGSVSKEFDGVTCQITRNSGNQPGFYTSSGIVRYYSSDVMTLSVASGNTITQIDFTMTSGTVGTASPTGLTDNTWTGSAESVSFTGGGTVKIASITVTYTTAGGSTVNVTSVGLDESSITLEVDETQTLTATVLPNDATNKSVTWESDDEDVATVVNGLVTAVGAGDATITCKSVADDTKYAECAVHVNPSPYTKSTLIFTAACGGSGTADDAAVWTVTSDGTESTYVDDGIHYGTSSASVTYVQLATSDIEGTIAKVVVRVRDAQACAAISVTVGGNAFTCTGSATATNTSAEYTFTGSGSGEIIVRVDRGSSKQKAIYVKSIVVSYIPAAQKDPAGLEYATADQKNLIKSGASFTAPTLTNPNGLTVSYESSNTAVAEVASDGAVTIKAAGFTEITASFAGNDDYKAGSATYTLGVVEHDGTALDPYTVADAKTVIDVLGSKENVYVSGIVSEANLNQDNIDSYHNATYWISDNGVDKAFEIYRGKYIDNANVTSVDDILVGDEVVVFGNITKFNSTYEFSEGNYLISLNRTKAAAGLAYAETTIEKNVGDAAFTNALTNPNSLSIAYSSTATGVATVDENGEVTIVGMGTTTIKATFAGNASYLADEVSYTLTVEDPSLIKVTFDATIDKGESPLSKSNITLSCSNGVLNNESEYRLYKNSTTTFACSAGNIAMIEFIGVSGNPASGFAAPAEGDFVTDGNNATWTGNAASISFEASGAQVRATKIFVSYREDTRAEAGLEYAETAIAKTVGDDAFVNALTNPNGVDVTYESSDIDVAEVASDGTVTIKAQGTATITASFVGNTTYKPASVSYELTVNEPGLDNVTFDAAIDVAGSGELSITKSGFTLTFTGGAMDNGENYRLYKNQTMTLSSSNYLIKKIEFTCTSGNPIDGFADATGLDKANNQWTGEASKVELTASGAQVRIEKLKVYYVEDTRAASGLAWSTDEVEITLGETFTAASLVNPNSIDAAEISIESSNTSLATVTAGVVELVADATGTATITATFNGNATYKPADFSYTITVNDPNPLIYVSKLNVNFASVEVGDAVPAAQTITVTLTNVASVTATLGGTNADAFSISPAALTASGDITISILANTDAAASYSATLTISDGEGGADDKTVNLSFAVTEPVAEDDVTGTWTLVTNATTLAAGKKVIIAQYVDADGAINTMAGQATNNRSVIASTVAGTTLTPAIGTKVMTLAAAGEGKFYLMTSAGEYLYNASTSSKSYLKTKAEADDASWTISVTAEGVATITSVENTNRSIMRYNPNTSGSPLFNCYASGQEDIALYMLEAVAPAADYTRDELTTGKIGTLYVGKATSSYTGATFYEIAYKSADGKEITFAEVTGQLAANTPYIFEATAAEINLVYENPSFAANDESEVNGLVGTLTLKHVGPSADIYYISNNKLYNASSFSGTATDLEVGPNRCYIDITAVPLPSASPAPGKRYITLKVDGENAATGFDQLTKDQSSMTNKVIIDGHLYILRGEKMYNANGQLVK